MSLSVAQERSKQRAELKSKPPELPVVLEHLERRLKEKAHTRAELLAWLDGGHAWCEWEGTLSTHPFETRGGQRTALEAFRDANPCVDVELRDSVEHFVYRLAHSFRNKKGLEAAIRQSRSGVILSELAAHMESEYKNIRQDAEALIREKRVFAVEDDRAGGKRGKILFPCVERGEVETLYADKELRTAYHEVPVPEHSVVLEALQDSEFKLPEDAYMRKRDRIGGGGPQAQKAAGRKRPRMRNMTNPSLMSR
jgi:hypothetical protein